MTLTIKRKSLLSGAEQAEGAPLSLMYFGRSVAPPSYIHWGSNGLCWNPFRTGRLSYKTGSDVVLIGEINEVPIEGFDMGNSPSEIAQRGREYFEGKTVFLRTTAGVRGVRAALTAGAEEVILGGFLTARAVASYVRKKEPPVVTLVAMGIRAQSPAPEDEACADYLESLLTGKPYDHLQALKEVTYHETAQKFLRGDKAHLPKEEPVFCLQRDVFDFVLLAEEQDGLIEVSESGLKAFRRAPGKFDLALFLVLAVLTRGPSNSRFISSQEASTSFGNSRCIRKKASTTSGSNENSVPV